jgi:acetolactate synthase-1/2/3 large subunit
MRLADYIFKYFADHGIRQVFLVTGGAAMHLNDAIGRNPKIKYVCCHHEQACAMAAEGFFRASGKMAIVQVTAGPGGINALNGVFGAWTDSIPMLVISGQSKRETLVSSTKLPLRQLGDQEVDIVRMVGGITKYAVQILDPSSIRYHLEKALYLAAHGRPGPVWLDIPIDVQAAQIDPANLEGFNPSVEDQGPVFSAAMEGQIWQLLERMKNAQRPVIYAGSGVRHSGQEDLLLKLVNRMGVPTVAAWNSHDLLPNDHPCYAGRPGSVGDRAGNFTVQNSDFLLILGCRLNIRLISYNWRSFAPRAFKVMVDVDEAEMKKPTLSIDLPIHANLRDFLPVMDRLLREWVPHHSDWLAWCRERVRRYPVVLPEYWSIKEKINPYCFMGRLSEALQDGEVVVCGDGTACVTAFQVIQIRPGMRLFHNSGCASMGYDVPAAIGAAMALPKKQRVICLAGDGSLMMNLQELQTVSGLKLPVKIVVLNNTGYHSIRQTQRNFFPDNIVGCGEESGLSFPDFEKVAVAFDLPFRRIQNHGELDDAIRWSLTSTGPVLCEVMLDLAQGFAPKLSSRKLEDGRMETAPMDDMAPFLCREELAENRIGRHKEQVPGKTFN